MVGGGSEEFVVILVGRWEPRRRTFAEDSLQEGGATPLIESGVVAENGFKNEFERGVAGAFEKGDDRGIGVGNPVPVLGESDESLCALIFWRRDFRSGDELLGEKYVGIAVSVGLYLHHVGWPQIVLVMEQIPDARGAIGFFPMVGQIGLVVGTDDTGVGGDNQAACGIENLRQFVERNVAFPFECVGFAGHRDFTAAFLADGNTRGHQIADVAVDVGVHGILGRAPDCLHDFAKLFPVAGFADAVVAVGESAGFGGGPAKRVAGVAVFFDDGAVAGDGDRQVAVGRPLNVNDLVEGLCFEPFAVGLVFVGLRRIESLDVEILHVGAVIREAPCNPVVVADDGQRRAGNREAFDVPAGAGEVHLIPDGRYGKFEVGVIGEQRLAGGRVTAGNHPVVAAERMSDVVFGFAEPLQNGRG